MLTSLFLAATVAASVPSSSFQDATPASSPANRVPDLDAEFQTVKNKFERALSHYQAMRLEAVSKGDKSIVPAHPAREFLPQFQALAEAGQCRAMGWIFTNLNTLYDDPAEARRQAEYLFAKMFNDVSNDACMFDALAGIGSQAKNLGESNAVEMCRLIADKSQAPEVRARAMHTHAAIVSENGRTQDATRLADAGAIHQAILETYPRTKIAQQIAGDVFHATEKQFLTAEQEWASKVEDLAVQGRPISEWPPQPIHEIAKEVKRVADSGFVEARTWYDTVYDGYTQAEKQGLAYALTFLVEAMQQVYSSGYASWDPVRMGILEAMYRVEPSAPWVYPSLRKVIEKTRLVDVELLEPVINVLLEKCKDPAVRPVALYTLARSLVDRGTVSDIERALPMYREVIEKYPDSDLADPAKRLLSRLENVMPGGKFPYFAHKDTGGVDFTLDDYKGRVLMLEFFSLKVGDYTEPAAQRVELVKRMAERPFNVIGFNVDLMPVKTFINKTQHLGINWRNVMLLSRTHVIKWEVNKFPTTIVLDSEGIVRGRDLPWPEMVKLTERLVAEAEQKAAQKPKKN